MSGKKSVSKRSAADRAMEFLGTAQTYPQPQFYFVLCSLRYFFKKVAESSVRYIIESSERRLYDASTRNPP